MRGETTETEQRAPLREGNMNKKVHVAVCSARLRGIVRRSLPVLV